MNAIYLIFVLISSASAAVETEYNCSLGREILLPLSSAAYADDPTPCMNSVLPGARLIRRFEVPCDSTEKNTCSAYTFIDESRKMIGLVFRGTNADEQFEVELPSLLATPPKDFQNGGKVVPYFNDGFFSLWNASLDTNMQEMIKKYPDFDLYITGHSLGGAMAAISASHIIASGIMPKDRVLLYTFGEPRIGDAQMATILNSAVAYRVVHNRDLAPHIPFQSQGYQHHGKQVFYENGMELYANYTVCKGEEDPNCANKFGVIETNFGTDHVYYYARNVLSYGAEGCPKTAPPPSGR